MRGALFFMAAMLALIIWSGAAEKRKAAECQAKGGVFISRGQVCVDKKALIT